MKNSDFQQNVVIVTGASSGIGEALAYQLADQGARLSLAARSVEQLEAVAAECRQRGGRCLVVPTDVSEESQCRELVSQTFAEYGRIETLFNNAGISMWAIFARLQELDFLEQLMRVNYFGSVYCTYYALPYLKETKGRIVGVSSLAGKTGLPTRTGYAASKHAQVGFFDSLRIEVAPYGVSVTLAYPDFVATEIRKRAAGADGRAIGKSHIREEKVMTAETCAKILIRDVAKRKRESYMTGRGKISAWLRVIAPSLLDYFAGRAIKH